MVVLIEFVPVVSDFRDEEDTHAEGIPYLIFKTNLMMVLKHKNPNPIQRISWTTDETLEILVYPNLTVRALSRNNQLN